jgi:ribonuclease HI
MTEQVTEPIYHLAESRDWAASGDDYVPAAFEQEGFIHCSTARQISAVARRHYDGRNDLVLLTIDPLTLTPETLVHEDLYGLGEAFPPVYCPLPTGAVVATGPYLEHLEEGLWLESRFDRAWMDRVLHPDFTEVGRSGRSSTRDDVLENPRESFTIDLPLEDYRLSLIDEDVALVRYISRETFEGDPTPAHRTSVWVNTNQGWQLRFHQGTPLP